MDFQVSKFTIDAKEIKGLKIIGNAIQNRNNTHTIILLDVSGSMDESSKLTNVKKSLQYLIKFLQKNDTLSLVTFNNLSQILIENMNVTSEYITTFNFIIETLKANGGTNLSSGLLNVKGIIDRSRVPLTTTYSKTGLIILTDGHTNEGLTRSDDILRIIESMKAIEPNLSITTIGYNEDHNANLLTQIATSGGGSYNIVNNQEQIAIVLGDILGGLMTTVVQNVCVKYPSSWKCLNVYNKKTENDITTLQIGDINAESETIILFESDNENTIVVEGYLTSDFSHKVNNISWLPENISLYKDPYIIAYLRNAIAYILVNMNILSSNTTLLNTIKEHLNTIVHPLVPLLRQEIVSIENQIRNNIMNTSQNIQTSAFLGLARGTSAYTPRVRRRRLSFTDADADADAVLNNFGNITLQTPFSNRIQQDITQQLVNMSQQENPNNPET